MTKDMKRGFPLYCKCLGTKEKEVRQKKGKIFSGLLKMEFPVVGYCHINDMTFSFNQK